MLDPSGVRDRYQQFAATARELLADFRQVEENFRKLDRQLRERVAGWQGGKGELLDDILGSRESITGSDQGRSFQAFHDFLLSRSRQEELSDLLDRVHQLSGNADSDPRLRHVHHDWLQAAEAAQATVRQLSEQLQKVPRRPGVVREPAGDRPAARHRGPRAQPARRAPGRSHDGARRPGAGRQAADGTAAVYPRPQAAHRQRPHQARGQRRRERSGRPLRAGLRRPGPAARQRPRRAPPRSAQVGLADLVGRSPAHPRRRGTRRLPVAARRRLHDRLRRHQFRAGQLDRPRRQAENRVAAASHLHPAVGRVTESTS